MDTYTDTEQIILPIEQTLYPVCGNRTLGFVSRGTNHYTNGQSNTIRRFTNYDTRIFNPSD